MRPFLNYYFTEGVKYIVVLAIVYSSLKVLTSKKKLQRIGSVEIILFFVFWCYVAISAFVNGGSELLGYTVERYIFYSLPLFSMGFIIEKTNWTSVLKFLAGFGVVDAVFSVIEFVTKKQLFVMGTEQIVQQQWGDTSLRTYGLSGNYFLLAEILCLCGFAALYLYMVEKRKCALYCLLVIAIGLFTTGSRGYYVSFVLGCLIMYCLNAKNSKTSTNRIIGYITVTCFALAVFIFIFFSNMSTGITYVDIIIDRIRSITDFSSNIANTKRMTIWYYSIERWKNHFWFGEGAQVTDLRYSKFLSVTESGLLKRLVELGIIGTVLQYLTMFIPLIKGIKRYRTNPNMHKLHMFFFALIACLLCEDIVLQQYTSLEYTMLMWFSLSYILVYRTNVGVNRR